MPFCGPLHEVARVAVKKYHKSITKSYMLETEASCPS
jgi:hypothetical protein